MISAKLMNQLEKKGFELDFPSYKPEDAIIEILKQNNERLKAAIPLLLTDEFDYEYLKNTLDKNNLKELNKIILITNKIFNQQGIHDRYLQGLITKNKIEEKFTDKELTYYASSFQESIKNKEKEKITNLKERNKNTLNQTLSKIFSPAKIKIMNKIINYETLTNTELKYYYRSIRPLSLAILDEDLKEYIKRVENTKKQHR